MNRFIKYCFLLIFALAACEEIYTPDIEAIESVMVADARIVAGNTDNVVRLYESRGFNDESYNYPNISGATVYILDNHENRVELSESSPGVFPVNLTFNPNNQYKMIIVHNGHIFESSFEPVPKIPDLDTVYGVPETKLVIASGNNDADDIREIEGLQLYTDILNEKESPYYRFTARKIIQFTYPVEVPVMGGEVLIETMFAWDSFYPRYLFNIAAPPEFSSTTNIIKHPLYFMEKSVSMGNDRSFAGWILILYQYGISKSGYNYYNDLNKQLGSDGKLFDPMYVQARSNLKCTSDSKRLILGNFEISVYKEHRFFVKFISEKDGYLIKPIPYFYQIPQFGEQLIIPPDFWEHPYKTYPNEK
jgi:hypothetical protein